MIELNKIYNEDCLIGMKRIPDESVDMILCDLPFGTTRNKWDCVIPLEPLWQEYKRVTKPNSAIVLFAQTPFDKILGASNIDMLKYEWIWQKESGTGFLNAKVAPLKEHENILVFYRKPPVYNPQMKQGTPYKCKQGNVVNNYDSAHMNDVVITENKGERYPTTILRFARDREKLHPTQKPVDLLRYLILTYANSGEVILDNTIGSGSTAIACLREGRKFIGFEKDEKYFQTAQERIKKELSQPRLF